MASEPGTPVLPRVEVWTDGGCKPNPGPGGWAAILRFGAAEKELSGGESATTNNRMELTAAAEALEALTKPCDVVLHTGGSADPIVDAIRSVSRADDAFEAELLEERVRQFASESEHLIPAAGDALLNGSLDMLGATVDQSLRTAVDLLHNQIDETVFLARRARELGAAAASAFGAGFGGSVWAMARRSECDGLAEQLMAEYRRRFPGREAGEAFVTAAAPPAQAL